MSFPPSPSLQGVDVTVNLHTYWLTTYTHPFSSDYPGPCRGDRTKDLPLLSLRGTPIHSQASQDMSFLEHVLGLPWGVLLVGHE